MDLRNVDKNVLAEIALELDVSNLMKLCLTNKKFNDSVCKNEDFWLKKIMIDMPGYTNYKEISNSKTYKEAYEKLSLTEINLLVTLDGLKYRDENITEEDEEDEDDKDESEEEYIQIHVEYDFVFRFVPIWEIENTIKGIVRDYIQTKGLFGKYTIEVDGEEVKHYSGSMEGLNLSYGKHNLYILFDVVGDSLEEDVEEESQLLFEQIIREYFGGNEE